MTSVEHYVSRAVASVAAIGLNGQARLDAVAEHLEELGVRVPGNLVHLVDAEVKRRTVYQCEGLRCRTRHDARYVGELCEFCGNGHVVEAIYCGKMPEEL